MDSSGTFPITGRNLQSLLSMSVSCACSIPGMRAPHAVALQAPGRGGLLVHLNQRTRVTVLNFGMPPVQIEAESGL